MFSSHKFYLNRQKMLLLLHELKTTALPAQSLYIPVGQTTIQTTSQIQKVVPQDMVTELSDIAVKSQTGSILFWSNVKRYLIYPPFPILLPSGDNNLNVDHFIATLKQDYRIALILIRAGFYAIGLCQGEILIASKVGTGNIHSRQRQGGRSAKRFEHRRDKQIEYFLSRIYQYTSEIILPQAKTINYIVYGGSREIIQTCQKQCPLLQQFNNRQLPYILDIHNPNQSVLEESVLRIWSSTIIEII